VAAIIADAGESSIETRSQPGDAENSINFAGSPFVDLIRHRTPKCWYPVEWHLSGRPPVTHIKRQEA
jgi:hypothetical protein